MDYSSKHKLRQSAFLKTAPLCVVFTGHWIVILLITFLLLDPITAMADNKGKDATNCDIQKGACTQSLDGTTLTLEVLPRPVKAMQTLTFKVRLEGATADLTPPYIRLNMPAMDMGKNQVPLKLNAQNIYEGQGVIVRCRSGRRTWKATVEFPDIGSADFIFDVIY